ncbi:MAG: SDR family oxidoreductase [Mycobacteriales bacterium]
MTGRIVVTGADGYLGRRIAARLLVETGDRLVLTVRAADRRELAAREAALRRELVAGPGRVEVVAADLSRPEPLSGVDPAGVTGVVHAAARTRPGAGRPEVEAVNVFGALRVAEFARACPQLERVVVLSTLPGSRWGDPHGWSRREAERQLLDAHADLPLTIARLPAVVADDETGAVGRYHGFHLALRLYFHGLLPLLPGEPAARQYLTTADIAARGVAHLATSNPPAGPLAGVVHLTPPPAWTLTVAEVFNVAAAAFAGDPAFRHRPPRRPHLPDGRRRRVDTNGGRLRRAWPGYPGLDPRRLVTATCHRLAASWLAARSGQRPELVGGPGAGPDLDLGAGRRGGARVVQALAG